MTALRWVAGWLEVGYYVAVAAGIIVALFAGYCAAMILLSMAIMTLVPK